MVGAGKRVGGTIIVMDQMFSSISSVFSLRVQILPGVDFAFLSSHRGQYINQQRNTGVEIVECHDSTTHRNFVERIVVFAVAVVVE